MKPPNTEIIPPQASVIDEECTWTVPDAIHVYVPADPTPRQRMRLIEISGTLLFWDQLEEDIYSLEDGEPAV